MTVPTPIGRLLFTGGWTLGKAAGALTRYAVTGDPGAVQRATRRWAEVLADGWGLEVKAFGAERLDPSGTYVVMSNHQSHVDIVALFLALPLLPGFLAKQELRKIPIFGKAMEVGGHVFIDRRHRHMALAAIGHAAQQVRDGNTIVIFPEGTRCETESVKPFKKGGFHLAKGAGVPIVPVGVRGTARVLPKHALELRPGTVEVHIGEPIPPERVADVHLHGLIQEVHDAICELAAMPPRDPEAPAHRTDLGPKR